jgi:hypothetical protein
MPSSSETAAGSQDAGADGARALGKEVTLPLNVVILARVTLLNEVVELQDGT